MKLAESVDFLALIVKSCLQLLPEACTLLVELFVQAGYLIVGSFLVHAGQLFSLAQLLLSVLQVLSRQFQILGELLIGLVAMRQLVLQFLEMPQ